MAALRIGDVVCLYSEEKAGFLQTLQTSCVQSKVAVQPSHDREDPTVPDPSGICWQIIISSRYKLDKKYRKIKEKLQGSTDYKSQKLLQQAKAVAEAEQRDNDAEQRKHHGTPLVFGQEIELHNQFAGQYLHISNTRPSQMEFNCMKVELKPYHARQAKFKVMPKFKVKSEGDVITLEDQVVLESVKSSGHFIHVSNEKYSPQETCAGGHEANLSVTPSVFTVYKSYSPNIQEETLLRGGDVIRLFHKEIEAYLCAEGNFGSNAEICSDVHLRVRPINILCPKTVFPSTSAIVYWQVEPVGASYSGEELQWGCQVRLRHVTTRHYLKVLSDERTSVTQNRSDPFTIFRLHAVVKEDDFIPKSTFCRIEHLMTQTWLHANHDEMQEITDAYRKKQTTKKKTDKGGIADIEWTTAIKKKIGVSKKMQFADVFNIQPVERNNIGNFRFMAGIVPVVQEINIKITQNPAFLLHSQTEIKKIFNEVKNFMVVDGKEDKSRQKLLRNFRVIELLVEFLRLADQFFQQKPPTQVLAEVYDLLRVYSLGDSRKNEFYLARHHEFFLSKLEEECAQSASAANMMMELVKDNLKIICMIKKEHIKNFVKIMKRKKDYRYLELLSALCVCNGVALTENQRYITECWLLNEVKDFDDSEEHHSSVLLDRFMASKKFNKCVFHTALGQAIGKEINALHVSKDNRKTWVSIYDMIHDSQMGYGSDLQFLEYQLDLFNNLCHGNHEFAIDLITDEQKHVTWEEAFCAVRDDRLPSNLRAKYCNLIECAFITAEDVQGNLSQLRLTFIYHDAKSNSQSDSKQVDFTPLEGEDLSADCQTHRQVGELQRWVASFLHNHERMIANQPDQTLMIQKVLNLVRHMVGLGYYGDTHRMRILLKPLLGLIDGRNDVPFDLTKEAAHDEDEVHLFQTQTRFLPSPETEAIVDAKMRGLEILELFFNLRFNTRLETFVGEFKRLHERFYQTETEYERERAMGVVVNLDEQLNTEETEDELLTLLFTRDTDCFHQHDNKRNAVLYFLRRLFMASAFFKGFPIDSVLLDLCKYKYNYIVRMATRLLNRVFAAHDNLFTRSIQAQLLVTDRSCEVYTNVVNMLPSVRRLSLSRLEDNQVEMVDQFLDVLIAYCALEDDATSPHPINQRIIYNQGILNDLFSILTSPASQDSMDNYKRLRQLQRKTWRLVGAMACHNPTVQLRLFERLDELLAITGTESAMAIALTEVFIGNKLTCLKVTFSQVRRMLQLSGTQHKKAPELLYLPKALVKYDLLDIPLRRNQEYVMRAFTQLRPQVVGVLDKTPEDRLSTLRDGRSAVAHYTVGMIDLLASCAERGSEFTESLCQSILSVPELLDLLSNELLADHVRRPLLRFLHHVYFRTTTSEGQDILQYMGDKRLWNYLLQIRKSFMTLTQCAEKRRGEVQDLLKKDMREEVWSESESESESEHKVSIVSSLPGDQEEDDERISGMDPLMMCRAFYYIFDAVLPFLQTFYSCTFVKKGRRSKRESEVAHYLALSLQAFVDKVAPLLSRSEDKKIMITAHRSLLSATRVPLHMMEALQNRSGLTKRAAQKTEFQRVQSKATKDYDDYYKVENDINQYFDKFAKNFKEVYEGQNTVQCQLGVNLNADYIKLGSDEELPLGKEFQGLVTRFVTHPSDPKTSITTQQRYRLADILLRQLSTEGRPPFPSESERLAQEQIDVRCLQVLRALLHNLIVLIDPDEPSPISQQTKRKLKTISELQEFLMEINAIPITVFLTGSKSEDVIREAFCFLSALLYQGNRNVQEAMYSYFQGTRKERFFLACKTRLELATVGLRERRLLEAQHENLVTETVHQVKNLKQLVRTGSLGKSDFTAEVNSTLLRTSDSLRAVELELSLDELHNGSRVTVRTSQSPRGSDYLTAASTTSFKKPGLKVDARTLTAGPLAAEWYDAEDMNEAEMESALLDVVREWFEDLPLRDEGYLNALLNVIQRMCIGQFAEMQDYLRVQPDNYRSVNLVAELTSVLLVLLTSNKSSSPTTQMLLLDTLVAAVTGNPQNQAVLMDHKICDSLKILLNNAIQASPSYENLKVAQAISSLVRALLVVKNGDAKNHRRPQQGAKGNIAADVPWIVCDTLPHGAFGTIMCQCYRLEKDTTQDPRISDLARRVGFKYYQILRKFEDFKGQKNYAATCLEGEMDKTVVLPYYETTTMSVEVVRGGKLFKVYFPVNYKAALREEVKSSFNYGVERTGQERIQDFKQWSHDIIDDIRHTRKLQTMQFTRILTKAEFGLNVAMMLVSLLIMILMMVLWRADPNNLYTPVAVHPYQWGEGLMLFLAIVHYVLTMGVVITFFIISHPRLPNFVTRLERKYRSWQTGEEIEEMPEYKQCIRTQLLSFKCFWYLSLAGFSLAGIFSTYFNVFHLLHVAYHVQLLKRAIGAVTKNGMSLLLIYLFGLVFIYIFALVNFAFYRELFDAEIGSYCTSFYECIVTIHHRAFVLSLFEGVEPGAQPFTWYIHKSLVDLLFFIIITTIGLNMISGVIIDTFAQLRDSKWTTDQQMLGSCFICGRNNYDFEHKPGGFENHVKNEHNQWAYIFFMIHLMDTHKSELSALEGYIHRRVELGEFSFLPLDRALCIETETNQSHSQIQLLEARMAILVQRVKELETQQKKDKDDARQIQWTEQYQKLANKNNYDVICPTLNVDRVDKRVTFIGDKEAQESDEETDKFK